jgi:Flp pilus assembly protein CpaB
MFALIVAVLVGLGAAVAAKATGLFNKAEPKKEPPPILVLVAANNIFEGNMLQPTDVKLRPANFQEAEQLRRGELLPPVLQAAAKRFAKIAIPADSPIRKDYLEDLTAPTELRARLAPGTRAVNLAIPKPHAAGGLINVGDWVDIQLMAAIEAPAVPLPGGAAMAGGTTAQAAIMVRGARVIAKRNSLWPVNTPLGPDCPVNFTLEMNPYRAALVEFAKDKGTIVLLPVGDADKRYLEARRNDILNAPPTQFISTSFSIPDSNEYQDEDKRVASFLNGNYVISESDLARIFQLKYTPPPPPPAPEPRLEKVVGIAPASYYAPRRRGVAGMTPEDEGYEEGPVAAQGRRPVTPTGMGGSYSIGGTPATPFRFKPPAANCNTCPTKCGQK